PRQAVGPWSNGPRPGQTSSLGGKTGRGHAQGRQQLKLVIPGPALGGLLAVGLLASPGFAQSTSSTWNDLPDRFRIDAGYFGLNAHTVLQFNGGNVDFE